MKIYNGVLVGCVFESMRQRFWLIWGRVAWFCPAVFEKYDLHTDCHSGTKIGKLHYFVEKQKVHLSCLRDTNLWYYKQHVVPRLQSRFWLQFLFVCQILLKWGQCRVDWTFFGHFSGPNFTGALNCWIFLDMEVLITCWG